MNANFRTVFCAFLLVTVCLSCKSSAYAQPEAANQTVQIRVNRVRVVRLNLLPKSPPAYAVLVHLTLQNRGTEVLELPRKEIVLRANTKAVELKSNAFSEIDGHPVGIPLATNALQPGETRHGWLTFEKLLREHYSPHATEPDLELTMRTGSDIRRINLVKAAKTLLRWSKKPSRYLAGVSILTIEKGLSTLNVQTIINEARKFQKDEGGGILALSPECVVGAGVIDKLQIAGFSGTGRPVISGMILFLNVPTSSIFWPWKIHNSAKSEAEAVCRILQSRRTPPKGVFLTIAKAELAADRAAMVNALSEDYLKQPGIGVSIQPLLNDTDEATRIAAIKKAEFAEYFNDAALHQVQRTLIRKAKGEGKVSAQERGAALDALCAHSLKANAGPEIITALVDLADMKDISVYSKYDILTVFAGRTNYNRLIEKEKWRAAGLQVIKKLLQTPDAQNAAATNAQFADLADIEKPLLDVVMHGASLTSKLAAASSLVTLKSTQIEKPLLQIVADPELEMKSRLAAAGLLNKMKSTKVLPHLNTIYKQYSSSKSAEARSSLRQVERLMIVAGDTSILLNVVQRIPTEEVSEEDLALLGEHRVKQAVPHLINLYKTRLRSSKRQLIVAALGEIGDPDSIGFLENVLIFRYYPSSRRITIDALVKIGGRESISVLERLPLGNDQTMKELVAKALKTLRSRE